MWTFCGLWTVVEAENPGGRRTWTRVSIQGRPLLLPNGLVVKYSRTPIAKWKEKNIILGTNEFHFMKYGIFWPTLKVTNQSEDIDQKNVPVFVIATRWMFPDSDFVKALMWTMGLKFERSTVLKTESGIQYIYIITQYTWNKCKNTLKMHSGLNIFKSTLL